jgi:hypothetical protein
MTMPDREPIFNIQISRNVGRWGNPLGITQSFFPQHLVFLTFEKEPDDSGQDLFVKTTWYKNEVLHEEWILHVGSCSTYRYTSIKYDTPSKGKVDVFLCADETGAHARHIA